MIQWSDFQQIAYGSVRCLKVFIASRMPAPSTGVRIFIFLMLRTFKLKSSLVIRVM
jgi:hypothetical protein